MPETSAHVYVGVPPVAVSDCEYGAVASAFGSEVVEMERAAPTTNGSGLEWLSDVLARCCP